MITVSDYAKQKLVEQSGISADKVVTIYNAVDDIPLTASDSLKAIKDRETMEQNIASTDTEVSRSFFRSNAETLVIDWLRISHHSSLLLWKIVLFHMLRAILMNHNTSA